MNILEETIYQHANSYRNAIIAAQNDGRFIGDLCFNRFPLGCCGDTSYMLAEYLLEKGIKTIWYSACRKNHHGHAWLVLDDTRISKPTPSFSSLPKEIQPVMRVYGAANPDVAIDITHYEAENLCDGLFIDITGDQFRDYSIPVFVGQTDRFHSSFEFVQAHDYDGLTPRLEKLYRIVERYIDLP